MEPYRALGLTVPVADVLDASAWIANYAPGLGGIDPAAVSTATPSASCPPPCAGLADATSVVAEALRTVPLDLIRHQLRAALSELEMKLGTPMGVVVYKSETLDAGQVVGATFDQLLPRRPYQWQNAMQFYKLDLPGNVLSVQRIRGYLYGTKIMEWSDAAGNLSELLAEWPRQGALHILPNNLALAFIGASGGVAFSFWESLGRQGLTYGADTVPGFWAIDCTCGPSTSYGPEGHIELVLAHWVAVRAARPILALAGQLRTGGASSTSVSFDGFSRSVSISGTHVYSALQDVYKELEEAIDWERLCKRKRGLRVLSMGR